jgi:hypothetical protein
MKYTSLNSAQLSVGDIVVCHGGLFKITERHESKSHKNDYGPTWWTKSTFLGLADGFTQCSIPEAWRKDWNIQGNKLAYWTVCIK